MNLTENSELNNPQVQLTSGNSSKKGGQNYLQFLQSLVESIPRICEAVIEAKGGHFNESKV